MILSTVEFTGPLNPVMICDSFISYKPYCDCLGVRTDKKLSWGNHTENAAKKFNIKLKQMKHLKFLPKDALESIYFGTVIPIV